MRLEPRVERRGRPGRVGHGELVCACFVRENVRVSSSTRSYLFGVPVVRIDGLLTTDEMTPAPAKELMPPGRWSRGAPQRSTRRIVLSCIDKRSTCMDFLVRKLLLNFYPSSNSGVMHVYHSSIIPRVGEIKCRRQISGGAPRAIGKAGD